MRMVYYVVVCPDKQCRGVSILNKRVETVTCRQCDSARKFDKFRVSYEGETREEAVAARTKLLSQLDDDGPSFEEIKAQGGLEEPGRVFDTDNEDNRSDKEIVLDAVEDCDTATRDSVIDYSVADGVTRERADKIVQRLLQHGYLMEDNGLLEEL